MHNKFIHALGLGVLGSALALSGCSSDDAPAGAAVPPNAVTIDQNNADDTVGQAISTSGALLDTIDIAVSVETTIPITAMDLVNLVEDVRSNRTGTSVLNTPVGIEEIIACTGPTGGSITHNYSDTATSQSGSVDFDMCDEFGVVIDGLINYNATWNNTTGNYTNTASGSTTIDVGSIEVTLSSLSYNETGNELSGAYSINTFNYSINSTLGGGFLASLESPLVGTGSGCPDSGAVIVTGANNTRARGTISGTDVLIDYDDGSGTFVPATPPSVACSMYF